MENKHADSSGRCASDKPSGCLWRLERKAATQQSSFWGTFPALALKMAVVMFTRQPNERESVFIYFYFAEPSSECAPPSSSLSAVWRLVVTVRCSNSDCFHSALYYCVCFRFPPRLVSYINTYFIWLKMHAFELRLLWLFAGVVQRGRQP